MAVIGLVKDELFERLRNINGRIEEIETSYQEETSTGESVLPAQKDFSSETKEMAAMISELKELLYKDISDIGKAEQEMMLADYKVKVLFQK